MFEMSSGHSGERVYRVMPITIDFVTTVPHRFVCSCLTIAQYETALVQWLLIQSHVILLGLGLGLKMFNNESDANLSQRLHAASARTRDLALVLQNTRERRSVCCSGHNMRRVNRGRS